MASFQNSQKVYKRKISKIIQTRDNNKDIKYIPINFKVVRTFFCYSLPSLKMPTRTLLVSLLCLVLGFSPVFVVYYCFVSTTFGALILELHTPSRRWFQLPRFNGRKGDLSVTHECNTMVNNFSLFKFLRKRSYFLLHRH